MSIPVNKVKGVGPKTAAYLQSMKINTAEELIQFGVRQLALAPGFSPGRAASVIDEATKLSVSAGLVQPNAELAGLGEKEISKPSKKDKKKDKKRKDAKKNKKDKKKNKKDKKKDKKRKK